MARVKEGKSEKKEKGSWKKADKERENKKGLNQEKKKRSCATALMSLLVVCPRNE